MLGPCHARRAFPRRTGQRRRVGPLEQQRSVCQQVWAGTEAHLSIELAAEAARPRLRRRAADFRRGP